MLVALIAPVVLPVVCMHLHLNGLLSSELLPLSIAMICCSGIHIMITSLLSLTSRHLEDGLLLTPSNTRAPPPTAGMHYFLFLFSVLIICPRMSVDLNYASTDF